MNGQCRCFFSVHSHMLCLCSHRPFLCSFDMPTPMNIGLVSHLFLARQPACAGEGLLPLGTTVLGHAHNMEQLKLHFLQHAMNFITSHKQFIDD